MPDDDEVVTSRHAGWLGTVIEISSLASTADASAAAHRVVMAEVGRLQRVFDVFDPASDLCRWLDEEADPSSELVAVVELAEVWRERSSGAFDPMTAVLTRAWAEAAARDEPPTAGELDALRASIRAAERPHAPRWGRPGVPYALNAIAKGWIVDRAVDAAWRVDGVEALVVNAGGDLVHRGARPMVVGIEDPARPYDNVPPLMAVRLQGAAIATSGGSRRGWTIAGRWYSHVIDPRSAQPVDHHASVSVLAPDAATADVVATVLGVLGTDAALAFVEVIPEVSCCIVQRDGAVHCSPGWEALELRPGS